MFGQSYQGMVKTIYFEPRKPRFWLKIPFLERIYDSTAMAVLD